jgi:hypothetical protein
MLFNRSDELKRVDFIEVEPWQSGLRYVVFLLIMGVAFVPAINIDPQFKFVQKTGIPSGSKRSPHGP